MNDKVQIRWLRIVAEAGAIVLSILLAFGLQAVWEERGTSQLRERALGAVLVDMEANSRELERWIGINTRIVDNSERLLDLFESAEGQPLLVSDTLLAAVVLIPTFDPRRAAVEAVTTTGSVTLVQDDTLQVWLGSWSRLLDDMVEDQTEVRTIESLQIVPALSRQVNLRPIYDDVLAWAGEEEPSALMTSNSRLVPDSELIALISHRRLRVGLIRNDMTNLLAGQDSIIARIGGALRR